MSPFGYSERSKLRQVRGHSWWFLNISFQSKEDEQSDQSDDEEVNNYFGFDNENEGKEEIFR